MKSETSISVSVVGAGGYSGAELVGILLGHGGVGLAGLFASARREKGDQPGRFEELFPRYRGRTDLEVRAADPDAIAATGCRAVFLATPHEASVELAPALMARGLVVFDLSAAFRLRDAGAYPKYYGFEHREPGLLERAVYGLAEVNRSAIARAELVAVPGCYPTSVILPLLPLVRAGAVRSGTRVIIDAVSGVSGAGRGLNLGSLFCEVSLKPYGVLKHRHNPEIDEHSGVRTLFTPHLGPYDRGILSTIHVDLAPGWAEASRLRGLWASAYGGEAFVRVLPEGVYPSVKDVERTNHCDIAMAVDAEHGHAILFGAIDNLVKGAAGQAVQCMNIRFGFPEQAGLLPAAGGAR